jgi:hypothetical protein
VLNFVRRAIYRWFRTLRVYQPSALNLPMLKIKNKEYLGPGGTKWQAR